MTNALVIDYDAFAKESRLYVMKDGKRSECRVASDINSLASEIVAMSQQTGIYNVKVNAPFAFIGEINRQVKQLEATTYAENKISVEGL